MTCLKHRQALIELAASSGEPVAAVLAHLRECPSCRATLEREQDLFASIDSHVRASADVEVPASLLPRVRARLDAEPRRILVPVRLRTISVAVAAAAVVLLSVNYLKLKRTAEPVSAISRHASSSAPVTVSIGPPAAPRFTSSVQELSQTSSSLRRQPFRLAQRYPKIIVSPEQEALLYEYATQLDQPRSGRHVVEVQSIDAEPQSLKVDLIQIAQLDVKPLAERPE